MCRRERAIRVQPLSKYRRGVNVLGYDGRPTKQTRNISFEHNVFTKMTKSLGGPARFMQIDAGPRDISIEHNTIDSDGSGVVYVVGGTALDPNEVYGFRMIGNAARHGSYGIHGAFFVYGYDIITHYFPGAVIEDNYLAGAPISKYPAPIIGPSLPLPFEAQFVNTAEEDYTLRPGSPLIGAVRDRSDIGADFPTLSERMGWYEQAVAPVARMPPPVASFESDVYQSHVHIHRHEHGRRRVHRGTVVDVRFGRLQLTRQPDLQVRGSGHLYRHLDCDRR